MDMTRSASKKTREGVIATFVLTLLLLLGASIASRLLFSSSFLKQRVMAWLHYSSSLLLDDDRCDTGDLSSLVLAMFLL
jgi:hypothetical protein